MAERDDLARQHLGLVHALCRRFADKGIEYDELFAAGCLGLTKALNKFDEGRGLQFSTYAFPVIAGEIKRLFRDGGAVKVSRSLRELAMKISKLNSDNMQKSGTELTVSRLAALLEVSPEKITEAIAAAQTPVSLTAPGDKDEDVQLSLPVPDIQEEITDRLSLRQAIAELSEKDRRLIFLRYFRRKTQTETAKLLQMTQVQVSRREKKILAQMRVSIGS